MTAATGPFEYSSSLANMHYFRERGGGLWCDVIDNQGLRHVKGQGTQSRWRKARRRWVVTVYANGRGQIARTVHEFTRPPGQPPECGRIVTRLVREALRKQEQ